MKNEPQSDSCSVPQVLSLALAILSLREYEPEQWRKNFQIVLDSGISDEWLYEAILQSYLFLGYPAAIEGLRTLSDIVEGKPLYNFESWSTFANEWRVRGSYTAGAVYRNHLRTLLSRLENVTPELTEWMVIEGYGKVLSRPRLPLPLREFLLAAILGAGTFTRQFEVHLHGCRNVGTPGLWLKSWFGQKPAPLTVKTKPVWEKFLSRYLIEEST